MSFVMTGTYNTNLVGLSFIIAILASYTALNLALRVKFALKQVRWLWLWGGAITMGTGIWSMHFIAMLAFHLDIPVGYDVLTTLLSFLYAVLASGMALWLLSRPTSSLGMLIGGGICMGTAISWMHYTGMAAMRLQATIQYDWGWVCISVLFAIGASLVSLGLAFRLQDRSRRGWFWQMGASGIVMGIAISGMHYTGMRATHFLPQTNLIAEPASTVNSFFLGAGIGAAALCLLGITFLASLLDQHLTAQQHAKLALWRLAEREKTLLRVVQRMRQTLDLNTIFSDTTHELRQALQCDRIAVYRFHPDWSGEFVAESVANGWQPIIAVQPDPNLNQVTANHEKCVLKTLEQISTQFEDPYLFEDTYLKENEGGIYRQGVGYRCVPNVFEAGFSDCYLSLLKRIQAQAYIIVPIFCGKNLWGLLATYQNSAPRHWQETEIQILTQVSSQLGVAVQQAELLAQTQQQAQELRRAKEVADAANHAKSEFLANMSHELRTPLNAILGFAQLMNDDRSLSPDHREYTGIINRSGEHLLRLLNDILEMSKIEAGRTQLNENDFDFYRLLDSLEEMFQLSAKAKGLVLTIDRDPLLPRFICADESKLRQVLINLLGNAIKFTEQGRVNLQITVKDWESKLNEKVEGKAGEGHRSPCRCLLEMQVQDTGLGIAEAEMSQLFQVFGQTETGFKSHQGTGLGLAISQKFVQLMGGNITVNSMVDRGSTFAFEIWVQAHPSEHITTDTSKRQKVKALAPHQPSFRILVVEDHQANCLLLVKLLSAIGFEVREAENGEQAIALWETWNPHLIWMDIRMPVMDGYEATRQIRERECRRGLGIGGQELGIGDRKLLTPNSRSPISTFQQSNAVATPTKIIALTASAFEEQRQMILSAGCDDFVRKPFQENEIFEKMSQHLRVEYVYDSSRKALEIKEDSNVVSFQEGKCADQTNANERLLNPFNALCDMPLEWTQKLHHAASQGSDRLVLELIKQIPDQHRKLADRLTELVLDFRFDQIINLTQPN
jgi:two-component system sensor histidine kinase/response regulator